MELENLILAIIGLILLLVGGDSLVKGAARLASSLGVSPVVVGLTVVAFGTSTPELLVSLRAATQGVSDLALGNILGSNIANIGLILGLTAMVFPIAIEWRLLRREIPLMIGISLLTFALALDGSISLEDGLLLLIGFIAFTVLMFWLARRDQQQIEIQIGEYDVLEKITLPNVNRWLELARLCVGILLLIFGAQWTVDGATAIARAAGVSELVIGITLVAFGTSLPELAASLMAAFRRENDIAVGNIIGSNIANLLLILGGTAIVQVIPVGEALIRFEFPVMIGFSLLLLLFLRDRVLRRWEGFAYLAAYVVFVGFAVFR